MCLPWGDRIGGLLWEIGAGPFHVHAGVVVASHPGELKFQKKLKSNSKSISTGRGKFGAIVNVAKYLNMLLVQFLALVSVNGSSLPIMNFES